MEATSSVPPNTDAFDPCKRDVSLLPPGARPALQPPATPAPTSSVAPTSDLAHLSQILTIIAGAGAFNTPSHVNSAMLAPSSIAPATPEAKRTKDTLETLVPSPSDIPRFLDYASTNLGVQNASEFESPLRRKGFGPDILSQIPDASLTALGLSEGDALRLKNGSQKWWNGPKAKRKLSEVEERELKRKHDRDFDHNPFSFGSPLSHGTPDPDPEPQCHYEYRFPGGGGTRYNGPPMHQGRRFPRNDRTSYWDQAQKQMLPIPAGYCAPAPDGYIPEEGEPNERDDDY